MAWRTYKHIRTSSVSSTFQTGDYISITYTGEIQETAPAQIPDVVKVQLLDDEK